jgi:hypothetical protein
MDEIELQPQRTNSTSLGTPSGWRKLLLLVLALAVPGLGIGTWLILLGVPKLTSRDAGGHRIRGIIQIVSGVLLITMTGVVVMAQPY